ncbi:MAG: lysophospholipid acyltransferase family protein, partial [Halieaceae bacterium]
MSTFDKDSNPLAEQEVLQAHIDRVLATGPLEGSEMEITYRIIKRLFKPSVMGAENIPDRPCLFIGNHSLFALDGLVLNPLMLTQYGRYLRAMGDKFLFANEGVASYVMKRGATMGHPEVCKALMADGQDILVFPGGAHEAVKKASDMYQLQWKERYGFVRLAAEYGYTIMPFGMVGPDEFYSHFLEGDELPDSAIGLLLKKLGLLDENTRADTIPPIPLGALGTLFPKPKPCYIGFGEPISLEDYEGKKLTKAQLKRIRGDVAEQIELQLAELLL